MSQTGTFCNEPSIDGRNSPFFTYGRFHQPIPDLANLTIGNPKWKNATPKRRYTA